eukprot:2502678-Amphidinium_carterae.1
MQHVLAHHVLARCASRTVAKSGILTLDMPEQQTDLRKKEYRVAAVVLLDYIQVLIESMLKSKGNEER